MLWINSLNTEHLSLRTPRSGAFVANLVAHQIDVVRDKVCDMVFRLLKNLRSLTRPD